MKTRSTPCACCSMPAAIQSISGYPPYCRRLGGIWPLTPFAKRQKICVLRAKNRFGKIHSCIPWVPDRVSFFWLGDGIVTADGWRDGGCMKHATPVMTVFLDRRDVMGSIGWCLLKQGSGSFLFVHCGCHVGSWNPHQRPLEPHLLPGAYTPFVLQTRASRALPRPKTSRVSRENRGLHRPDHSRSRDLIRTRVEGIE